LFIFQEKWIKFQKAHSAESITMAQDLKSHQMIQNLGRFRPRIQSPKNIGPNDVKFGPFLSQKVVRKLDQNLFFFQENWIKFPKVPSVESIMFFFSKKNREIFGTQTELK
jgi:hypothetical protein